MCVHEKCGMIELHDQYVRNMGSSKQNEHTQQSKHRIGSVKMSLYITIPISIKFRTHGERE